MLATKQSNDTTRITKDVSFTTTQETFRESIHRGSGNTAEVSKNCLEMVFKWRSNFKFLLVMKKRLLQQIDFKAIEPLEDQQLNVLVGGSWVGTLITIIGKIIKSIAGTDNCDCETNYECSNGNCK